MNEKQLKDFVKNNMYFYYINENGQEIEGEKEGFVTHFRFKNIKTKNDIKNVIEFKKGCVEY